MKNKVCALTFALTLNILKGIRVVAKRSGSPKNEILGVTVPYIQREVIQLNVFCVCACTNGILFFSLTISAGFRADTA